MRVRVAFCRSALTMDTFPDTIVATSAPLGRGARTILRLSGADALAVALEHFAPDEPVPAEATYRSFRGGVNVGDGAGAARVPATLFVMRAPRSYTREDVVELHVPGSPPLAGELMAMLCRSGARPAAPGEFTARAFAAGRIDLAQAEAVMAVVSASGRRSLAAAERLLEGRLSGEVAALAAGLRDLAARVELAIDFSEEDVPLVTAGEVGEGAAALRDGVVALARRSREVTHLEGDLRVAVVGRPNVGKSSLFNALAGADRAIVTDVAGTTRDELRESFTLAGSRFVLSDTAGLDDAVADLDKAADGRSARSASDSRGTAPLCPNIAVAARRHTLAALARAELVLVVVEAGRMVLDPAARRDVERLLVTLAAPAVLVANKCDLRVAGCADTASAARGALREVARDVPVVATSAVTGYGLADLRRAIVETLLLGRADRSADAPAVTARHRRCLETAAEGLERAVELCVGGMAAPRSCGEHGETHACGAGMPPSDAPGGGREAFSEELVALELREALDALGQITGQTSPEDVLSGIFSRFCIGK